MSRHSEELAKIMEVRPEDEADFADNERINKMPADTVEDTVPFSLRDRLEKVLPKSLVETMDDEEVATQIAIMDKEEDDALAMEENDTQIGESINEDGSIAIPANANREAFCENCGAACAYDSDVCLCNECEKDEQ